MQAEAPTPTPTATVTTTTVFRGFSESLSRYHEAAQHRDGTGTYLPLFEALNWCASLDYRLQAWWRSNRSNRDRWWCDGFTYGDTVLGTRFARNCVHHQWAEALRLSETAPNRSGGFSRVPRFEWRWREALPPAPEGHDHLRQEYRDNLASNPARDTLEAVVECVAAALKAGYG